MKTREKDTLMALRLLHAEIKHVAINERREVTDDDALTTLVEPAIAATAASGKQDFGKVLQALMPQVKGRADGTVVNAMVSQKLS